MKSIKLLMVMTLWLSSMLVYAQGKNPQSINVKIFGNCDMCEGLIEKAGSVKNVAQVDWNKNTQMASVIFDANETNADEIMKRIALAGYDNDQFLAPDDAYAKLPDCCKYERSNKTAAIMPESLMKMEASTNQSVKMETHENHGSTMEMGKSKLSVDKTELQKSSELQPVFDQYFKLKDALVQTNGKAASAEGKALLVAIDKVKMVELESKVHNVWMVKLKSIRENSEKISQSTDPADQRGYFAELSEQMYELMKVSNPIAAIYYQKCPMYNDGKGATWLSKESDIKNPFYGSTMLTCGSTIETITN